MNSAARLILALAPAELGPAGPEDVPAAANALNRSQLAALNKASNNLDVRPVPMVHSNHHDAIGLFYRA